MDSSVVVTPPYLAGPLRLHPFRGLMLAPSRIGDPSSARAFARPYRDVAARLTRWQAQGQLHHDDAPAVYLHEYTAGGITIRGLVGAIDISRRAENRAERVVYPHEGVHPVQAAELAERMAEMQLNPAPILLVHRGRGTVRDVLAPVLATTPDHEFSDRGGQRHRVWAIRAADDLAAVDAALAGSRALIADGHHRYDAYLRLQQRSPGRPTDLGLAMLVDQDDTPLFLGAIHRVLSGPSLDQLAEAASTIGMGSEVRDPADAVARLGPNTLVATDGDRWATLALAVSHTRAPVEVVHDKLIPALPTAPTRVTHWHTVDDALTQLTPGRGLALLLPAPDFDLVLRIVAADRLLPEKATSFQPKANIGVLIRSLRDE
jgi:uncharacterized protein (DUF1015 family)